MDIAGVIRELYAAGHSDYDIPPLVHTLGDGKPDKTVCPGDSVVFCCRRGERETELTEMFTDPAFSEAERQWLDDLTFVTLTQYHEKLTNVLVAFPPQPVRDTLAECISRAGRTQYHCAESEKFAHVTFFLNGGVNHPFPGEKDDMTPSIKEGYEHCPALSAPQVTNQVVSVLGQYDFIAVNYANGDVIGHLCDPEAKIAAASAVSEQLSRLIPEAIKNQYVVLVTADHGNLESMIRTDGTPDTSHTANPVPFIVIDPENDRNIWVNDGCLANVAPTVLQIMGIDKPASMTAGSLISGNCLSIGRRVLLIILDGWGIGRQDETNPIFLASTTYWDSLLEYPHSLLQASGSYVGLSDKKSGNSEAGHLNIGAGRIVPQDDTRIDRSMADGSMESNPALLSAIRNARERGKALHLIGLLSETSSHGSVRYITKLCSMAKDLSEVYIHLIIDGRNTKTSTTPEKILKLSEELKTIGNGRIVTCMGRKYAMDRDKDYARVKKAYDAMVLGQGYPFS